MEYQIESVENITLVHLKGAFDRAARRNVEIELLSLVKTGHKLLIDLSNVNFISSAGLHLLLLIYRSCTQNNTPLALTSLSDPVHETMAIAGLTSSSLPIYDTLEEGLAALKATTAKGGSRGDFSYEGTSGLEPSYSETLEEANGGEETEEVHFSAFYPKEVVVEKWYTLLVYAYVPSVIETVRADAHRFESEIGEVRESKPATSTRLAHGTEITIVPRAEGIKFNPDQFTFQWLEDLHRARFRLQAQSSLAGMAGNLEVTVYVGPLIVGTLKMGMLFIETEASAGSVGSEEAKARMYHQDEIFISYSHRDTDIVRLCKKAYEALGDNVLVDFESLRAGQSWNAELMRLIEKANIFQLFWSENSSTSDYCRQEWQYALRLQRGEGFIRPVYWKEPLPTPPDELRALHFDFAPFEIPG